MNIRFLTPTWTGTIIVPDSANSYKFMRQLGGWP